MRLLIVEQGINLRFWIHSNQPVNQILWNERRRELEKHLEHRGKTTEITVMLGGKCTQNFMVWAGQGKDTIRPKQPKKTSCTGLENEISTNMPPHGRNRSLHRVWNTKCENPLTGMEPGTSLKVYSVLLARGFWPSSSHTEWEEERRFTKDRKDCGDRKSDFL